MTSELHYWWVNQGQSHAVETSEEFLFANLLAVDGRTVPGYDAMGRLSVGDVLLHYFQGKVQAVSSVGQGPSVQAHPHDPSREGRLAKVEIHWLTSPIALSEIPLDVREVEVPDGPFTSGGAVQQGYLRPVSKRFVDKLVTMYPDRFPSGSPVGSPGRWDRFAHFARLFYEDDEFFEGDERRYKRTIADRLEQAIAAFRHTPRPTEDDALSEEQRAKYLEAENPAQAARVLGVSERRYRDLLRAQDVYVSRGGQFDEAIRMQVLPAALELSGARRQGDWRHQLKRAFGPPNNMTAWQAHDSLLKWLRANPSDAEAAMNSLLNEDATPAEAIRGFCRAVPPDVVSGRASRLAVASFILYGTRPDDLPPFRNSLLVSALEVLDQGSVATGPDEGALYEEFLGLLDRTMAECEARGLTIRNRIDTQGILWCVISDTVDPLSSWSPEERLGLLDFRAGKGRVITELEDPVSDDLAALVQRFRDETGYPTDLHRKKLAERDMLAAALTPEALEAPDAKLLHQLASRTYIGPGVMPAFNATVSSEGGPEAAGQALSHLLYGDGDEATRITSVADGAHKVPGMRGAIATKALSIVYPDRWIPVCGVSGVKGKKAMIRRLDLEPLEPGPVGNEVEASNEQLFRALAPHFGTDTYGMSRFLFWELEREEAPEGPTLAGLAAELFVPVESLEEIVRLLEDKKQVIFYGPPGTGKTYIARKLAEFLGRLPTGVTKLQFHPSYAYEDFVEGFRPKVENEQPVFRLVDGPLKRAAAAAADSTGAHLLLIDEINRGNIAKIFGELYYLLEYRDEEIELQYSDTPFSLPENLWIIGTMNTADRTIALLDAALRRRFHFVGFFPDEPPIQGLLERWLAKNKPDLAWVADVVHRANERLPDKHRAIGPSHFMKPTLDEELVDLVWRRSVLPYIEEQYFGEEDALDGFALELLKQGEPRTPETFDDDPTADAD